MKKKIRGEWDRLRSPFTGTHWWYRILTGTRWTFPFMKQDGDNVYFKALISDNLNVRPAKLLNVHFLIRIFLSYLRTLLDPRLSFDEGYGRFFYFKNLLSIPMRIFNVIK